MKLKFKLLPKSVIDLSEKINNLKIPIYNVNYKYGYKSGTKERTGDKKFVASGFGVIKSEYFRSASIYNAVSAREFSCAKVFQKNEMKNL